MDMVCAIAVKYSLTDQFSCFEEYLDCHYVFKNDDGFADKKNGKINDEKIVNADRLNTDLFGKFL